MPLTFDEEPIVLRIQGGFGRGVDAENAGTLLVAKASAISAGEGLQFTDDGDQTVTLQIMGDISADIASPLGTGGGVQIEGPASNEGLQASNAVPIRNATDGFAGPDVPILVSLDEPEPTQFATTSSFNQTASQQVFYAPSNPSRIDRIVAEVQNNDTSSHSAEIVLQQNVSGTIIFIGADSATIPAGESLVLNNFDVSGVVVDQTDEVLVTINTSSPNLGADVSVLTAAYDTLAQALNRV